MKFMECEHCKNIMIYLNNSGVLPVCCGSTMKAIVPGSVDGSLEKHVPIVRDVRNSEVRVVTVEVGESPHPMSSDHYIQWILLETDQGVYIRYLKPAASPQASFRIDNGERIAAVYAYCNIHGLWKAVM